MPSTAVALLAEGVDRNQLAGPQMPSTAVALLAEGVDRNKKIEVTETATAGRPPRGGRG